MSTDLNATIAKRFKRIRKQLGGTQERFAELSGLGQVRISRLERGIGWGGIREIGDGIAAAGGDPLDLLRDSPIASPMLAEIQGLLPKVDDGTLMIILQLLQLNSTRPEASRVEPEISRAEQG